MNYDTLFLDADNTLFDFDRAEHEALKRAMTERGYPFTPETESVYLTINRGLWEAFDRGEVEQKWLVVERFRRLDAALGGSNDPEAFNRDYLTYLGQGAWLLPGALELCRELKQAGCRLAIATNGVARVQHARMDASPLAQYIDGLFISEELGAQKPQAEFFLPMLERMGVADKGRCLMVGDNLRSDILGGRNAGLPTVWYNPRRLPNPTDIRPTFTVATYQELKDLIFS